MDEFVLYFQENYCSRIEQWATHARCYTPVNTNMHLESFHRLVKVVYFQQKQNRRVDALLNVLLKLSRYKAFKRLQKLEKGKNSYRISEMNERHKHAEQFDKQSVNALSSKQWMVKSQEIEDFYTVERLQGLASSCTVSCKVKCTECGIYPHIYTCTCIDSVLQCHNTALKHIHFVHIQEQSIISSDHTQEHQERSTFRSIQILDNIIILWHFSTMQWIRNLLVLHVHPLLVRHLSPPAKNLNYSFQNLTQMLSNMPLKYVINNIFAERHTSKW